MKHGLLFAFVVSIFMFSACGGSSNEIIGSWEFIHEEVQLVIHFYADNTGTELFQGNEFNFTWSTTNDELHLEFIGEAEESALSEILALVIHGVPVEFFRYAIDGQGLMLADSHGHRHIEIPLHRVEN